MPTQSAQPRESTYAEVLCAIAGDIEAGKDDYPQLAEFTAATNCDPERLEISYGYHTHRSKRRGGWAAAVPNPDDDGVWFHLDFHDPNSRAQIHTQPVVFSRHFRSKRVMLLLLDGSKTRSIGPLLNEAMTAHGVETGRVP